MEDLWKLTRIDYRISAFAEQSAYEEIVRRYHHEEGGDECVNTPKKSAHSKKTKDE